MSGHAAVALDLSGGYWDKIGNIYEQLWVARHALAVIYVDGSAIRCEPVEVDAEGFEFEFRSPSGVEWHQSKILTTGDTWTIARLSSRGVLASFKSKLVAEPATECVFVSNASSALEPLLHRAKRSSTCSQFLALLGDGRNAALWDSLKLAWGGISDDFAFDLLSRFRADTVSEDRLRRDIIHLASVIFEDVAAGLAAISEHLDQRISQTVSTDELRRVVLSQGGGLKNHRLDETIQGALTTANSSYRRSFEPFGFEGEVLERSLSEEVFRFLSDRSGPNIAVLDGAAGSGKSGIVIEVLQKLSAHSIPAFAFRVDRMLDGVAHVKDVGVRTTGRNESPVVTVGEKYRAETAVIVIDQLDAVSEASGRSQNTRDLIFDMIAQAESYPYLKLVLSCRTYDLGADSRLKDLLESPSARRFHVLGLDWETETAPALSRLGVDVASVSQDKRELLSSPLSLALLSRLPRHRRAAGSEAGSLKELFDHLINHCETQLAPHNLGWTVSQALVALASRMSENRILLAPEATLSSYRFASRNLQSLRLVSEADGALRFFHESLFDYSFALGFIQSGRGLAEFLTSGTQELFTRTQVRQILAHYRSVGGEPLYLRELQSVLGSDAIRFHIRHAICGWLASLSSPHVAELDVVRRTISFNVAPSALERKIFNAPAWAELALKQGMIAAWMRSGNVDRVDLASRALRLVSSQYPGDCAAILRLAIDHGALSYPELLHWFIIRPETEHPEPLDGPIPSLYFDAIDAQRGSLAGKSALPSILDAAGWLKASPLVAVEGINRWLQAWFGANTENHPFDGHSDGNSWHWFEEVSKKEPLAFAKMILPHFSVAVSRDFERYGRQEWGISRIEAPTQYSNSLLLLIRDSLQLAARSDPESVAAFAAELVRGGRHHKFLALACVESAPQHCIETFEFACADPEIMEVGYRETPWQAFALAWTAARPHLSEKSNAGIEEKVLAYYPEITRASAILRWDKDSPAENRKHAKRSLSYVGYAQWCFLSMLDRTTLSTRLLVRLAVLDRKAASQKWQPYESGSDTARLVGSPIPTESARHMSDANWRRALHKHALHPRSYFRGSQSGGNDELSRTLGECSQAEPSRFAALLTTLSSESLTVFAKSIVRGVSYSTADPAAADLCAAFSVARGDIIDAHIVGDLAGQYPAIIDRPEIKATILALASSTPTDEGQVIVRTAVSDDPVLPSGAAESIDDLFQRRRRSVREMPYRSGARDALAKYLRLRPTFLADAVALIRKSISEYDPSDELTDWSNLVISIAKSDPATAHTLVREMLAVDGNLIVTPEFNWLGLWAVSYDRAALRPLLDQLTASDDVRVRVGALIVQFVSALSDADDHPDMELLANDEVMRRVRAFVARQNMISGPNHLVARAWLLDGINDPSEIVRREAAKAPWGELLKEGSDTLPPLEAFVASPQFLYESEGLMIRLDDVADRFPELYLSAIKRLLDNSDQIAASNGRHSLSLFQAPQAILKVYRECEHNPALRAYALDVLDMLLASRLSDAEKAIEDFESR